MESLDEQIATWLDKSLEPAIRIRCLKDLSTSSESRVLEAIFRVLNDHDEPADVSRGAGRALARLERQGVKKVEEFDLRDATEIGFDAYESEYNRLAGSTEDP